MPEKTRAVARRQLSLKNYGDLFRALYGPTRIRWKPRTVEIVSMRSEPAPNSEEREQLLSLAESDRTLKKTRDLMLFGTRRLERQNGDRPVREFVRDVLRRHPAFRTRSLVEALEHPDRSDDKHTLQILGDLNYGSLPWQDSFVLSKRQAATCRANALHCLLLWYRESLSSPLPLGRIHRHLRAELWETIITRRTSEADRALVLIKDRDSAATAIACALSEARFAELQREAQDARASASQERTRTQQLGTQLGNLQGQLNDARNRVNRLTGELSIERTRHAEEEANIRDDAEKLRGRILQCLETELSLLTEGLHALRRDPPRVSVMDDHADRVIDGLMREVRRLRGG